MIKQIPMAFPNESLMQFHFINFSAYTVCTLTRLGLWSAFFSISDDGKKLDSDKNLKILYAYNIAYIFEIVMGLITAIFVYYLLFRFSKDEK